MKKYLILTTISITLIGCIYAESNEMQPTSLGTATEETVPQELKEIILIDLSDAVSDNDFFTDRSPKEAKTIVKIPREKINEYASKLLKQRLNITMDPINRSWDKKDQDYGITQTVANVCEELKTTLERNRITSIDRSKINYILKVALARHLQQRNLSFIPENKIAEIVNTCINQFFTESHTSVANIPNEMKNEFDKHRSEIIASFRQKLERYVKDQLAIQEIQDVVRTVFESFIKRMEHVILVKWVDKELEPLEKTVQKNK